MKLLINLFLISHVLLLGASITKAGYGIPAYCAHYPTMPIEAYPSLDGQALSKNPSDYSWKQVHVIVRYTGVDRVYGYTAVTCTDINGTELDNLLFTMSPCSKVNMDIFKSLQDGDVLDLFCMVESTLSSGKTIVMIEKLFINEKR